MTARTYKPRRIPLTDGETLALRRNGSIDQVAADGTVSSSWTPDDPAWGQRAIRFGLQVEPVTIHPSGRSVPDSKPPA